MECLTLSPSPQARFTGALPPDDAAIPEVLKEIASTAGNGARVLGKEDDCLWVTGGSSFKKIDLTKCRKVRLVNRTPARGPGFISIMAANKTGKGHSVILDYDRHTEELFDEAKRLAEEIGCFLGYQVEIAYDGADC
ncbi:hypothetical protein VSU19_04490 [Verrucomicrobiales bacterium BCK34]|nr:hypothetical protein [Verrucomicrobiales bacterium BCK34]